MTCEITDHKKYSQEKMKEKRSIPIVVIGAGVAGLTVAANLDGNFLVLEARNRIGGRVFTREHGSCSLDMGAAWIHGSDNNPLNPYVKYNEMIPVSNSNPWIHTGKTQICYAGMTEEKRQQMIVEWNLAAKEMSQMKCKTVAEAFTELGNSFTFHLDSFLYMLEVWCGTSVLSMPSSFLQNIECDDSLFGDYSGSHYLFKKGASSLITSIAEHSKQDLKDKIIFEQVVTDVLYDRDDGLVEIRTRDPNVSYLCEKLIITTPPGPLQDINFVPPLSASRKCALSKIKMGSYKKVQLTFDRVFWNDDAMILTQEKGGFMPYILWNNYACLKSAPVLEAICPANIGWQLSGKSDEEIADAVLPHMRNLYPWMPDPVS